MSWRHPGTAHIAALLLACSLAPGNSSALAETWAIRNPRPLALPVGPVTSGNGLHVAMGLNTLVVSNDGKTWRDTNVQARAAAFGRGIFAATTGPRIVTSTNGIEWKAASETPNLGPIVFGGSQFVAAGSNGLVVTSTDGVVWKRRKANVPGDVTSLAFGNERYVAVAGYDPPRLVASRDAVSWSEVLTLESHADSTLLFGHGQFAVISSYAAFTSVDGLHWTSLDDNRLFLPKVFFHANNRFIWLGYGSVLTSSDFKSVKREETDLPLSEPMLGFANGLFYATDEQGAIYSSPDLKRWTCVNAVTTQNLWGLASGGGSLVVVGDRGTILKSQDGVAWTALTAATTSYLHAITYRKGRFIAAGAGGTILTSADGTTWTIVHGGTIPRLASLAFTDHAVVAVGAGVLASSDGVSWTQGEVALTEDLVMAAAGNGRFAAVGYRTVMASADGTHWEKGVAPPGDYRSIDFHDGLFRISTDSEQLVSRDGKWWKPSPASPDALPRFGSIPPVYFHGQYVAVGYNGQIATLEAEPRGKGAQPESSVSGPAGADVVFASRVFVGEIDRQYVFVMTLTSDGKALSGSYRYLSSKESLGLKGTISADGEFDLREYSRTGKNTGRFHGTIQGRDFLGEWSASDRSQPLYFDGYESSLKDISARQDAFKQALKDRAGTYEVSSYEDSAGANTMYSCGRDKKEWRCSASALEQGRREAFEWETPGFLTGSSLFIEIDTELSISLVMYGERLRTIPVQENPLVFFPMSTTLAKNIPIAGLSQEDESGRYSLKCSTALTNFTLGEKPALTFVKRQNTTR